jgi:hypothetical protein
MKIYDAGTKILCPSCKTPVLETVRPIAEGELVHAKDVKAIAWVWDLADGKVASCGSCQSDINLFPENLEEPNADQTN